MKILVYDDSPHFGGHQIMACRGVTALAYTPHLDVACVIHPMNTRMAEYLTDIPAFHASGAVQQFRSLEPDIVLCIQGDIRQSIKGVKLAKRIGAECISYIANSHGLADMGAKMGVLRDRFYQPLVNKPDRYITISERMKNRLIDRGCSKPISVVPNGIPIPSKNSVPRKEKSIIGLIGRIEFSQKRQDFMVHTFLKYPDVFHDYHLLIVGAGPDMPKLLKTADKSERVTVLPWQDDMETVYEQIDLLVIPSRYEGVPLVMLEALARGIPVIGSACDGMLETLPEGWLFEPENSQALANAFYRVQQSGIDMIDAVQQKILAEHSIDLFKSNFVKVVTGT